MKPSAIKFCQRCGERIQRRRIAGTSRRGWRAVIQSQPYLCRDPEVPWAAWLDHAPAAEPLDLSDRRAVERWLAS